MDKQIRGVEVCTAEFTERSTVQCLWSARTGVPFLYFWRYFSCLVRQFGSQTDYGNIEDV